MYITLKNWSISTPNLKDNLKIQLSSLPAINSRNEWGIRYFPSFKTDANAGTRTERGEMTHERGCAVEVQPFGGGC